MSSAITSISNATAANTQTNTDAVASPSSQMLSEKDFLNLLVTQMTSQDPMNPISNQDLLGQMVQFGNLQNNTSMQSLLTGMQSGQTFSSANSLIGRQVNLQVDNKGNTAEGVVSGVDVSSGAPLIIVNGQSYNLGQVLSVTTPSTSSTQ